METARLRLRRWRPEDREPFFRMSSDPVVMRYFPSVLTRPESDALCLRLEELIARRGWGFWALETQADGAFIGFTGLHIPAPDLPFGPCIEIGWRLAREAWGHGYATEAAREALRFGFEDLGRGEIVSFTSVLNLRSRKVMDRLGMRPDGEFDHPGVPEGSPLRRHVLYRLGRPA
jgi:RimJ/RimL family protein N-acetyltransferase